MIQKAIQDFPEQFVFEADIQNASPKWKPKQFIVAGVGGSALAARLLMAYRPTLPLLVHSDYNLPSMPMGADVGVIVASYSGNTEEPLSAFDEAMKQKIPVAAVSIGGKLLKEAKEKMIPYVMIPNTGIPPRMATGFMVRALLRLVGDEEELRETEKLASILDVHKAETEAKILLETLKGKIPVLYASTRNTPIAYIWKIKFNETAKIPSFSNTFPELNHNEMTGFDPVPETKELSEKFHFVFLRDEDDHEQVKARMKVTADMYKARQLPVTILDLRGKTPWEKIFQSVLVADWTAFHLSEYYGTDPENVPMVEDFKKRIG